LDRRQSRRPIFGIGAVTPPDSLQTITFQLGKGVVRHSKNRTPKVAQGLVSRVTPVQTAMRNCTRDEGRPFGFGDQVADPKPPRAAAVKSRGGERRGNVGTMIPAGKVERGERKQTASEASKAD